MIGNGNEWPVTQIEFLGEGDEGKLSAGIPAGHSVHFSQVKVTLDVDATLAGYINAEYVILLYCLHSTITIVNHGSMIGSTFSGQFCIKHLLIKK